MQFKNRGVVMVNFVHPPVDKKFSNGVVRIATGLACDDCCYEFEPVLVFDNSADEYSAITLCQSCIGKMFK